jgi:RNA polymerase sigma factor (sigma-70 family)
MSDVTVIFRRIDEGDRQAAEQLLPIVYGELRKLAAARMARESAAHTLQPTALVHEAWMRLGGENQSGWQNRAHFFAAAAEAMRRILIDRARRRLAVADGAEDQLIAISEALEKFAQVEPKKAELVKLRYFIGLTLEQASDALGIPHGTGKRWWTYARAWLYEELRRG